MSTRRAFYGLCLLALLLSPALAFAQSGGGFELSWWTVEGGGFSAGGPYMLGSAIGQPDAGTLSGGSYTLIGGFWSGTSSIRDTYLPMILRG
ncbi:MAG: hypothetical protein GXP39_00645 [Chloroflexi bacterium]|nr:hypothetical protein [Chloroflexota bacterium]